MNVKSKIQIILSRLSGAAVTNIFLSWCPSVFNLDMLNLLVRRGIAKEEDVSEAEWLAFKIADQARSWNDEYCQKLCDMAGLGEEYRAARDKKKNYVSIIEEAADRLGVEVW